MDRSERAFILLQTQLEELKKQDNPVTTFINQPQVKSILGVEFSVGPPQWGNPAYVGLLYECRLPEEPRAREPKKTPGTGHAFQKRPKPEALR